MKIIKPGKHPKWTLEATCTGKGNGGGGCGAKLLLEEGDLFHTFTHRYGDSRETYTSFRCCSCKCLTDLSVNIPPHVTIRDREPVLDSDVL